MDRAGTWVITGQLSSGCRTTPYTVSINSLNTPASIFASVQASPLPCNNNYSQTLHITRSSYQKIDTLYIDELGGQGHRYQIDSLGTPRLNGQYQFSLQLHHAGSYKVYARLNGGCFSHADTVNVTASPAQHIFTSVTPRDLTCSGALQWDALHLFKSPTHAGDTLTGLSITSLEHGFNRQRKRKKFWAFPTGRAIRSKPSAEGYRLSTTIPNAVWNITAYPPRHFPRGTREKSVAIHPLNAPCNYNNPEPLPRTRSVSRSPFPVISNAAQRSEVLSSKSSNF